ncbi:hypothetical protein BASA81_008611 [Batrachochytrium salamandrivorans]|nr:hypothetical protein BASA81_008611 [Batrachochytrium salamandrivorans]
MPSNDRVQVMKHYHESLAHLKYGIMLHFQFRPVPPVALPFERWGIDFYGPMVETKSGRMEENSEFIARNLRRSWSRHGSAANVRTKAQAEAMRKRNGFDENTPDYLLQVSDMVKMKHHDRQN